MTPDDPRLLRAALASGVTFALMLALGVLLDRQIAEGGTPCVAVRYMPATLFPLVLAVEARRRWGLSFEWTVLMALSWNVDLTLVLWLFFPGCVAPSVLSQTTAMLLMVLPVATAIGWLMAREKE